MVSKTGYYYFDNNGKVISWIQRRCSICHRFLSKIQKKYCLRCSKRVRQDYTNLKQRRRYKNIIDYRNHRKEVWRNWWRNKYGKKK